jgi:copper chaperone CopZ
LSAGAGAAKRSKNKALSQVRRMRYMERMKNSLACGFVLSSVLALGLAGCDKAGSKSEETPSAEIAAVQSATVEGAAVTTTANAEDGEASCAGADNHKEKHAGADCAKKSAESGEGMGCNKWDKEAAAISKRDIPKDASWQVLKVEGMTCGGCEQRIIANVGKLEGVVAVEADSELGQVRVAVASGDTAAGGAASAKISELGYTVQ